MLTESGSIEHYLLKQLYKFVGEVSSHEGLHRDTDVFWVLGLAQCRLHDLSNIRACVCVCVT